MSAASDRPRLFLDAAGLPCADPWLADPAPDPGLLDCPADCGGDCVRCAQLGESATCECGDVTQAELEQLGHDLQRADDAALADARSSLPYGVVEELLASWRAVAAERTEDPFDVAREPRLLPGSSLNDDEDSWSPVAGVVVGGRMLH